jgi:uncharacterized membrane protein
MVPFGAYLGVIVVGVLHILIMVLEMVPWDTPIFMAKVLAKRNLPRALDADQHRLVATIVHNAAIYNGIVGAGLLVCFWIGQPALLVTIALLVGVMLAGIVGASLSRITLLLQTGVAIAALAWLLFAKA